MATLIVLWLIAVALLVANGMFSQKRCGRYRQWRAALSWALVGGCIGALFTLVGFGAVGAAIGAAVAYLAAARRRPQRR